ncbi:GcvT family protein [Sneathiella sp. HT1-7]|uniref:GcvT family protein n=1 Tax=Sneathiella sp. HT1-7 TaxID=2887192 RepID=UPI001D13A4F2|nr:FAD-dependent oxidoreductase [Sneathiella sp. HT1-7]MCC3305767.1 FAD-dependent oxidoreductase [Sneathiella sp. HT1-7]
MKSHVKVAVVGGGVVGCSVLYHLAKLGWTDIALIEQSELTSGSTWHAAGGFHTINSDTNIAALQGYTIKLYKELEELSGQSCGLHHVGGITLAGTPDRMDYLKTERAKHRYMGLDTHIIGPAEIKELSPITNVEGVIGGLYDPLDGHLDPSGTTHAYAMCARKLGAEIYLRNPVLELNPQPDGSWQVVTKDGTINAEYVVNAGGLWARELGEMVGIFLPLHPMEHQYLITEDIPEIYELGREHPHVMDPEGESYLRQEGRGLCIGFYEQDCDPWGENGTPLDFGHELLPNKLDRIEDSMEFAFNRFPVLGTAGVKNVINGPFTFAPDGNPLVGPVPGLRNYWSACAVMAGFSQGGGVGLTLAEWMIEGEPSRDVFAMDVARYGDYCSRPYARKKVTENYQRRFSISYPNEELPAARPFQTTPAYPIWKEQRAVFGQAYGMEAVNYFAPEGEPLLETPSFRRSNAFDAVSAECRAVREKVGITEIHNFGKYKVMGPKAAEWIDMIMAGRVPKVGRMSLSPMLSPKGRLIGDFTIARLGEEEFQLTASFGAQAYHLRWFWDHLPETGVEIENVSLKRIGFQIAGPRARDLLAKVTYEDASTTAFPFMAVKRMGVGLSDAIVQRVTYTGDLGYEIYVPADEQIGLYEVLAEAGEEFGLTPFGMRAMMSLRLEKSFGSWLREFKPDYTAEETGLDRFVAYNKPADFIGKAAVLEEKAEGVTRKLSTFVVEALDADVHGDEPIWKDGKVVGFVTSGGYAHYVGKSVAIGFTPPDMIEDGGAFEIEILGEMRPAKMLLEPLLDPTAERMRG